MSTSTAWAELIRCGGSEDASKTPTCFPLTENPTFFGRTAKPQVPNDHQFTHDKQYVIDFLFVSSTHFSIEYTSNGENARVYTIRDFSRNGTFLDGVLIGKETKILTDGAEISLKYRDNVKLMYRFAISSPILLSSPAKVVNTPETNQVITSLNQQITMLQDQAKKTDVKLVSQAAALDSVKEELENANRTVRSHDKTINTLQQQCSEAKERYLVAESNGAAIQARLQVIESRAEDAEQQVVHWKNKANTLQEELKEKSARLDELQLSLNQNNQIATSEHHARIVAESQLHEHQAMVNLKNNQIQDLTKGNHALQRLLQDTEKSFDELHKTAELYKTMLIAMQQRAQEQSEKHKATIQTSNQLSAIVTTLTEQAHGSRRHADIMLGEIVEFQQSMALIHSRPSTSSNHQLRHATQGMEETAAEIADDRGLGRSQQELGAFRFTQVPFSCPPAAQSPRCDNHHNGNHQTNDYTQAPYTMASVPEAFALNQEQQDQKQREREQEPPLLSQESHIRRASNTSPTKSSKNSTTTKASINLMALQSSQENVDGDGDSQHMHCLVGDKRGRSAADEEGNDHDMDRTEMPETNADDAMDDGDGIEDLDKTRIESVDEAPAAKRLKFSQQQLHRSQPTAAATSAARGANDFTSPRSNASFYAVHDEDDENGSGGSGPGLLNDDDRQRTIDERSSESILMDHMN